jgi:uncharacterized protein YtpQ (UPF0354 family)
MRFISIILIFGLFIIGCNANNNTVTVREFTQLYVDSLTNKFPAATFRMVDDSTIVSRFQDNDIRIFVDNAYKEYKAEPDSLQKVLSKYLATPTELFSAKAKINIDRIVPIIKPIRYLDEIKNVASEMGPTRDTKGVYERYNDQLIIAYAEDKENTIRYLTHADVKSLSINEDSIKQIAVRNLDRLLASIQKKGGDGVYMITAGGDYEASIILLDNVLTKENLPVDGDLVIAIPNRDMLLITGTNNKAGIEKIKEVSKKSFETGSYQVSEYLYKWNGKTFEKFE